MAWAQTKAPRAILAAYACIARWSKPKQVSVPQIFDGRAVDGGHVVPRLFPFKTIGSATPKTDPRYCFRYLAYLMTGLLFALAQAGPTMSDSSVSRWAQFNPTSEIQVNHQAWDELLKAYLIPGMVNLFRYADVAREDSARLNAYLSGLAKMEVSNLGRDEQLALWLNLYNALTVRVVLDHYPVASIREINISPGLFTAGPWGKPLIIVEGVSLTLNDIEHKILRPLWNDARVHYGLNCASLGCPNLQPRVFTGAEVWSQLDAAAREFVNGHGITIRNNRIVASRIYSWFARDFGRDEAEILAHILRFASPALSAQISQIGRIVAYEYDWALNDG